MALEAYVAHVIPGRLRLKIPAAKGRPELLQHIASVVGSASNIKSVECNPVTGSVVICYAPAAYKNLEALGSILGESTVPISMRASHPAAAALPRRVRRQQRKEPSAAAQAITSFFNGLDQDIREATDNEVDLKVLLPLGAGALGLVALGGKAATPLWVTLLIFAFHSFLTLHSVAEAGEADELLMSATNGAPNE
jgi:hypothetical protein